MSAPVIWIILPIVCAIPIWVFRKNRNFAFLGGIAVSLVLAILAATIPIEKLVTFSFLTINISATFSFLGRKLVLVDSMRPLLVMSFIACFFWLIQSWLTRIRRVFAPLILVLISLFIAATAVEPFLYSSLIIEVAVLLSCIILVNPGRPNAPGLLRYLIYQTLAVPFILFSGWITGVAGINPADPTTINLIVLLVGLGFAFWLAVFPFYTWIPLLSEESEPISQGFILGMLPSFILFLLLKFLDGYIWLRESAFVFNIFRVAGILMVATGGIWSLFQKKLSRLFGYAVIMETGFVLIALGLKSETGLQFFALSIFPRMFGFAVWSFILAILQNNHIEGSIEGIKGLFKKMPWVASAVVAILLAFAGAPLFGFSPERLILLQALANQNTALLVWVFLGILGFIFGAFRFIVAIFLKSPEDEKIAEGRFTNLLLIIEVVILILMGIVPSVLFSGVNQLLLTFPFLKW